jgi:hypothetical protein
LSLGLSSTQIRNTLALHNHDLRRKTAWLQQPSVLFHCNPFMQHHDVCIVDQRAVMLLLLVALLACTPVHAVTSGMLFERYAVTGKIFTWFAHHHVV